MAVMTDGGGDGSGRTRARRRAPAGAAVLQEDVTAALKKALFEELAEVGYGRLSIEAVARRAGVGKTAVYRRWPSKEDMVVAAVSEIAWQQVDMPDTGSLRSYILAFLSELRQALTHPLVSSIILDLFAEVHRNPSLAKRLISSVRDPRRQRAAKLVEHGIARGDLPADIDASLALDLVAGPLYWRLTAVYEPVTDAQLDILATAVESAFKAL